MPKRDGSLPLIGIIRASDRSHHRLFMAAGYTTLRAMSMPASPTALEITDASLAAAAEALRAGRLVAFATETVYGLGADATNDQAVAKIFAVKGRPAFNPLIVHVADLTAAETLVRFDERAKTIAARFWPGPLTLVLPRLPDCPVSLICSAGLDTLALRIPGQDQARRLLSLAERPVAAPSANRSGRLSPTSAAHVADSFAGEELLILDDGPCPVGLESTVLDLSSAEAAILRPGAVTAPEIEAVLGPLADMEESDSGALKSPGLLSSHYAPAHPLRLNVRALEPDEALLAFGPGGPDGASVSLNLSPTGDLLEAAANLFSFLHQLDKTAPTAIAVMPIPEADLGVAINDRLRRAAR